MSRDASQDLDLFGRPPKGKPDWSHRRGEPRVLALAWTIYLMLTTMGSLVPAMTLGRFEPDVYRPAARLLIALVVVGLCVLWPMVRLTQRPARSDGARFVLRDLAVLLLPALALVWPQVILADWPVVVVGALSGAMIGWALMIGSVLLWWHRCGSAHAVTRVLVMTAVLVLVAGAPVLLWRSGVLAMEPSTEGVTPGWMWSPVTAAWEMVRDRSWSGRPAWVGPGHWAWVARLVGAGLLALLAAVWSPARESPILSD